MIKRSLKKIFNSRLELFLFMASLLLGLIMVFLIPPFQKPDEPIHFLRVITLIEGDYFCVEKEKIIDIDSTYLSFPQQFDTSRIAFNYNEKFHISSLLNQSFDLSGDIGTIESLCHLPMMSYLIFVPPILLGELFSNVLLGFYLSRLIALVFFSIAILLSLKILKESHFRYIILLFALIPMVLHQVSCIGYDYLQLSLAAILFSLSVNFFTKKIPKRSLISFVLLLVLFVLLKPGYYFIPFLYLLIPRENLFGYFKQRYFVIQFVFILLIISFIFLLINAYNNPVADLSQFPISEKMSIFSDMGNLFSLAYNTLVQLRLFYFQSFWGYFGWLDYVLPKVLYQILTISFIALGIQLSKEKLYAVISIKTIIILTLVLMASFGTIFFSLYITNPVDTPVIYGVQGRYFLVFFPYILFLFGYIVSSLKRIPPRKLIKCLIVLVCILAIVLIVWTIASRYYTSLSIEVLIQKILEYL